MNTTIVMNKTLLPSQQQTDRAKMLFEKQSKKASIMSKLVMNQQNKKMRPDVTQGKKISDLINKLQSKRGILLWNFI